MNDSIIILGSARSDGNTRKAVELVANRFDADLIDLNSLNISYYDYENTNMNDDFIPTAEKLIKYNKLIFATPVYWYSMSAIMKTFFDRFTDLITIRKDIGRSLAGKLVYVISSSASPNISEGFIKPFEATADYLNMDFIANLHIFNKRGEIVESNFERLEKFIIKLSEN